MLSGATRVKNIQSSTSGFTIQVSKKAMDQLNLNPRKKKCEVVELVDKKKRRIIYQVV